jgi:glycosyltransferase involved in cell wall biosynthesis/SAM-dependent methyltransferase
MVDAAHALMTRDALEIPVLVGHPFIPTGRGEDIRCAFRSFGAAGMRVAICAVSQHQNGWDHELNNELSSRLVDGLSSQANLFYINGDEVGKTLNRLGNRLPERAYNVICPQWELSRYPREWHRWLDRFDEVWAPSSFVFDAISKATEKPVIHVPLCVDGKLTSFLGRRYFGLPESAYIFLFAFDLRSYLARKNPLAVIEAFSEVCARRPAEDTRLVIKLHGTDSTSASRADYERLLAALDHVSCRGRIILVTDVLTDNETKNLVRCCDCFVSLHRSEGFGRAIAEAMLFGKPVVATGYSGNLDFMNETNSCLVDYRLVPVAEDSYPHAQGQCWAEPDIDHAAFHMVALLSDKERGRKLGHIASRHIRTYYSPRAVGLQYKCRMDAIFRDSSSPQRRVIAKRRPADRHRPTATARQRLKALVRTALRRMIGNVFSGARFDLVPPVALLFDGTSTQEQFKSIGEGFTRYFLVKRAGLRPDDRVLDIGCGIGQKARPLTRYLSPSGRYDGIDIVPEGIEWCRRNYRRFNNFHFAVADLFSSHYNPRADKRARDYTFPYETESFDLIFLSSVFTHMLPADMENYFSETARMLKPGGKCVMTFFLLNPESVRGIEAGLNTVQLPFTYEYQQETCRIADRETPETIVAHDESYVRSLHQRNHLTIVEITYGYWCGREESLGCMHDVIIAVKNPSPSGTRAAEE